MGGKGEGRRGGKGEGRVREEFVPCMKVGTS